MKGDTTTMAEDAAKEHSMQIEGLDHLVLTVGDVGRTRELYERVLGMESVVFGEGRHALAFGGQKINLHEAGREFEPKAAVPIPGSADLCFLTNTPMAEVVEHLGANGVEILEGPCDARGRPDRCCPCTAGTPTRISSKSPTAWGGDQPASAGLRLYWQSPET
jgi:catechol 2,3-dioxygenase-like lactoylglutathione lyase family enzyme